MRNNMTLSQQQKEELNNEFYTWSMKVREISALTGEETANWWLSKFDQLMQEKVEKIEKMPEGETYQSKEFAYKEGFYQARVKAVAILKD